ncbi:LysM peptidoglycan-binding domain-containing protein, partial [Pseudomonas aeruginosa]
KSANRLSSNHLRKGQQLSIPGQIAGGAVKPVYQQLARQASTPARTRSYKVKNGDSLWQIARNNGVDVNDLKRWNGLDKHALKVGQTLKLQGGTQALA